MISQSQPPITEVVTHSYCYGEYHVPWVDQSLYSPHRKSSIRQLYNGLNWNFYALDMNSYILNMNSYVLNMNFYVSNINNIYVLNSEYDLLYF